MNQRVPFDSALEPLRLLPDSLVKRRYDVQRLLGRGGMGEVYYARDRELERDVALKVLPSTLQRRDPLSVERFLRQARLAARVMHPAVVQIYDCGMDGDLPYVVQELLRGCTVGELLVHERKLEPTAAVELLRELCGALIATHAAGVIHRDIKPDNLFLHRTTDERARLKLLDFGLARLLRCSESLTRTHEVFGTLSYMAPEQLRGARGARIEADVYAVGSVLFELLTGRPPFVRQSRAELKLALLHDPAPDPREFEPGLPHWMSALCLRALAKQPEERFATLSALVAELDGAESASQIRPRLAASTPLSASGFRIERQIGRGAHGQVFAALAIERDTRVALKCARSADLESVARLKRESRTLRTIDHPNVVQAHSLFEENDHVWLELALIEGQRFDEYVRGSRAKLRASIYQLGQALSALHAAGLAHGDLKPSNVIVDRHGHVVLIDFGMAGRDEMRVEELGTVRYRAPESQGGQRRRSADVYAFGRMIDDALAVMEIPSEATSSAADPCALLAAQLCDRDPTLRPTAREVVAVLAPVPTAVAPPSAPRREIARLHELASLRASFCASSAGHTRIADIVGTSGVGKSTLLRTFLDGLPEKALILRGAQRYDESVALSWLDAPIDELAEHLRRLPAALQRILVPSEVGLLVQRFPALLRVDRIRELAGPRAMTELDRDANIAAFRELRKLLVNLTAERPIVLAVEDLHAASESAIELLSRLVEGTGSPPMLVLLTRASDHTPAALTALLDRSDTVQLRLSALPAVETLERLRSLPGQTEQTARALLLETNAHPYLLSLVELASSNEAPVGSLDQAIERLVARLSAEARRLLNAVCSAEAALPASLLCSVASAPLGALDELVRAGLILQAPLKTGWAALPRHPAVRKVILQSLHDPSRLALHRRFVELVSEHEQPIALIQHLAQAGRSNDAGDLSMRLADQAEARLDFAAAASFYQLASSYALDSQARRAELLERCARALHVSGRNRDAARTLQLRLTLRELPEETGPLERRTSELLLLCGEVREGLDLMHRALARHGLALARDLAAILQETLAAYMELKTRGLEFATEFDCGPDARERVELLTSVAMTLSHVDLRGLPFAFRALQGALALGDDALAQKACAVFVWSTVSHFPNDLVEPALALCRVFSDRVGTPYAHALLLIAESEYNHCAGRFLAAEAESERAEHLLVSECSGVEREVSGVRALQAFMQYAHKGDFQSRVEQTTRWMAEAERSGNRYWLNMLRSAHALVWVAKDRPELARQQLADAERDWPEGVSAFEVTTVLFLDVIDRYEGNTRAHLRVAQGRTHVLSSPMANTPMVKGYLEFQRAWGASCALARGDQEDGEAKMLPRAIRSLRGLNMPLWNAFADASDANHQLLNGDLSAALRLLERSELAFRELHMLCLAASARRRRGELTRGVVGTRIRDEAERELRGLGVLRVDKWCRAYFSPFANDDPLARVTCSD